MINKSPDLHIGPLLSTIQSTNQTITTNLLEATGYEWKGERFAVCLEKFFTLRTCPGLGNYTHCICGSVRTAGKSTSRAGDPGRGHEPAARGAVAAGGRTSAAISGHATGRCAAG